jgi:hypothetical protein
VSGTAADPLLLAAQEMNDVVRELVEVENDILGSVRTSLVRFLLPTPGYYQAQEDDHQDYLNRVDEVQTRLIRVILQVEALQEKGLSGPGVRFAQLLVDYHEAVSDARWTLHLICHGLYYQTSSRRQYSSDVKKYRSHVDRYAALGDQLNWEYARYLGTLHDHAHPLDDLKKLGELRDAGILDEEEFQAKKKELMDRI